MYYIISTVIIHSVFAYTTQKYHIFIELDHLASMKKDAISHGGNFSNLKVERFT